MEPDGVTDAVGDEGLLPGAVDPDAAAVDLRGAPGAQRLVQGVLLIAEAAADIGLDDLNIRPRRPKACPTIRRMIWGIWVELTTTTRPFSS